MRICYSLRIKTFPKYFLAMSYVAIRLTGIFLKNVKILNKNKYFYKKTFKSL